MFSHLFGRHGLIKILAILALLIAGASAFLMTGSAPSNEAVKADIDREVEKNTVGKGDTSIQSIETLDGWSNGVELEVIYSLNPTADSTIQNRILAGLAVNKGKELRNGKIAASYQWNPNKKTWELIRLSDLAWPQ